MENVIVESAAVESTAPVLSVAAQKALESAKVQAVIIRANKAAVRSADMDQRVAKRKERLSSQLVKITNAKKGVNTDQIVRDCTRDKIVAERKMADADQTKAAQNHVKLNAWARVQLRKAEIKIEAEANGQTSTGTVWTVETVDGVYTPVDVASVARQIKRSKVVTMGFQTAMGMFGEECIDAMNDRGGVLVCNEMRWMFKVLGDANTVEFSKVKIVKVETTEVTAE